jgi:hypothetical protein
MKNIFPVTAVLLAISFFGMTSFVNAQAFVDLESGAVFTAYNNVRIPGDVGTLFSLKNDLNTKPGAFIRIRAGYTISSKHTISLLYAPLTIESNGTTDKQIFFQGVNFPSDNYLNASFRFNSYRITYRYDIVKRPKIEFGLGVTAKIRDAEIALSNEDLYASKTNVGFVPIINFRLNWKITDKIGLLFEGDALAAPQGRAEDVMLAGTYNFSDRFQLRLAYRILEGGADGKVVYSFSMFHYAAAGALYTF